MNFSYDTNKKISSKWLLYGQGYFLSYSKGISNTNSSLGSKRILRNNELWGFWRNVMGPQVKISPPFFRPFLHLKSYTWQVIFVEQFAIYICNLFIWQNNNVNLWHFYSKKCPFKIWGRYMLHYLNSCFIWYHATPICSWNYYTVVKISKLALFKRLFRFEALYMVLLSQHTSNPFWKLVKKSRFSGAEKHSSVDETVTKQNSSFSHRFALMFTTTLYGYQVYQFMTSSNK